MVTTVETRETSKEKKSEKIYSVAEYFRLEEKALHKHEYHAGHITRMAGAKLKHNLITVNIITIIHVFIRKNEINFKVSNSDTKVRIEEYDKIVYPDALVICEKPEFYDGREDTIINPLLVVEVLSNSTGKHDRTTKFEMYATLPSFKEYVLVDQSIQRVTVWSKQEDGAWMPKIYVGEDSLPMLKALNNCELPMRDIYYGVD